MTLPLIFHDGAWVLGADGLAPEDLAPPKTREVRRDASLMEKMQKAAVVARSEKDGNSRRRGKIDEEVVEATTPNGAKVIVESDRVRIYERDGAIVVQERYVKRVRVRRVMLVRDRRRGLLSKEVVVQTVEDKPATVVVPAVYRDDVIGYLRSLAPKDRRTRAVVRAALALLS